MAQRQFHYILRALHTVGEICVRFISKLRAILVYGLNAQLSLDIAAYKVFLEQNNVGICFTP